MIAEGNVNRAENRASGCGIRFTRRVTFSSHCLLLPLTKGAVVSSIMNIFHRSNFSRRNMLRQLGATGLLAAVPWDVFAEDEDLVTVSILNTTDLHGHIVPTKTYAEKDGSFTNDVGGLARCITQIRAWQKDNPNNILIDVGDIYQGTHVSWSTQGQLMMKLLNSMNYDAWVVGNHEFDWGYEPMVNIVKTSTVPVLASNAKVGGKWTNKMTDKDHPLGKIKPYIIKEIAGFKIGIIGTVTPGLPAWLAPRLLGEFTAEDPVKSIDYAMKRLREEKVDAIVLASHMGLKGPFAKDDFANRINQIAAENVGVDVIIAGHTHRDLPNQKIAGVPYSQANYYGINCGKIDLVFSKKSRKLEVVNVGTKYMDSSIAQDPMILSASAKEREGSDKELVREIGELKEPLSSVSAPGKAAETLLLLTRSMRFALEKRKVPVDGVLHGSFYDFDIKAGKKTIADAWEVVPYENFISTSGIKKSELMAVVQQCMNTSFSTHNLDGFAVKVETKGKKSEVLDITLPDGSALDPEKRYRIALNSYDAQSGGMRYTTLQEVAASVDAKSEVYDVQSRESLIEYFTEKKSITRKDLGLA